MRLFDQTIKDQLSDRLSALEQHFDGDVLSYYGEISPGVTKACRDFIEKLKEARTSRLIVFLNTPGGSAETVEKMVEIMRFRYPEVYFVVPDFAMSAGTILCMSGDKIFMDDSSSHGPIDPQVHNEKKRVPLLCFFQTAQQLLAKVRDGTITRAESREFQSLDLAIPSRY